MRVRHLAKNRVSKRAGRGYSFLARPKPRIPFLGLSLLRNHTETRATQASQFLGNDGEWIWLFVGDNINVNQNIGTRH